MSVPADWTAHRRDDGELVGWIRPDGDRWVAIDLLGHEVSAAVEWLDAEVVLEDRGIGWLAGVWMLDRTGSEPVRVKIVEVAPTGVVVQTDDFGAIDAPVDRIELPWPAPEGLRPRRG